MTKPPKLPFRTVSNQLVTKKSQQKQQRIVAKQNKANPLQAKRLGM